MTKGILKAMKIALKTWNRTKHQHLYRHKSGVYYACISLTGNKTWRSLKTSVLSVALAELDESLKNPAHLKEISAALMANMPATLTELCIDW